MKIIFIALFLGLFTYASNGQGLTFKSGDTIVEFTTYPFGNDCMNCDPDLTYFWFKAGQLHATKGGCAGKVVHGVYRVHSTQGTMLAYGMMEYGLKTGTWRKFNPVTGDLAQLESWNQGKRVAVMVKINGKWKRIDRKRIKLFWWKK